MAPHPLSVMEELAVNCQYEDSRAPKLFFSLDRTIKYRTMIPQRILQPRMYISYNLPFFLATQTNPLLSYATFIPTHPISQRFSTLGVFIFFGDWYKISSYDAGTGYGTGILAGGGMARESLHSLPCLQSKRSFKLSSDPSLSEPSSNSTADLSSELSPMAPNS